MLMSNRPFKVFFIASVVVLILPACAIAQQVAVPTSTPFKVSVSAAGAEKEELSSALSAVNKLMVSREFWNNFLSVVSGYGKVYVGPNYREQGMPPGMASQQGALRLLQTPHTVPVDPNNTAQKFRVAETIIGLTGTYWPKGPDFTGQCTRTVNGKTDTVACRGTEFKQSYSNEIVVTHGIGPTKPGVELSSTNPEIASIEIGREYSLDIKMDNT